MSCCVSSRAQIILSYASALESPLRCTSLQELPLCFSAADMYKYGASHCVFHLCYIYSGSPIRGGATLNTVEFPNFFEIYEEHSSAFLRVLTNYIPV